MDSSLFNFTFFSFLGLAAALVYCIKLLLLQMHCTRWSQTCELLNSASILHFLASVEYSFYFWKFACPLLGDTKDILGLYFPTSGGSVLFRYICCNCSRSVALKLLLNFFKFFSRITSAISFWDTLTLPPTAFYSSLFTFAFSVSSIVAFSPISFICCYSL